MAPATQVICKQCMTAVNLPPGQVTDVHLAISCGCCPEDHHHGEAAAACPRTHDGPCWNPPAVKDRPDGCTVCRPLLILPVTGTINPLRS